MRLDQFAQDGASVRLWGAHAALELHSPLPGVLRLRHAPVSRDSTFLHPRLPSKQSFAVVAEDALPLTATRTGDQLEIRADGITATLRLGELSWTVSDGSGPLTSATSVFGRADAAYPQPRYRTVLHLEAPPGEAYLGFGEKVGPLDKRGMRLQFWNTDVIPHHPDTDPLYVSIPFLLALRDGRAWGLFLDESWRSEVDVALSEPERLSWESTGPELDCYLIAGPHPEQVLSRFVALTGRPPLPPLWALGAQQSRWGYENADDVRAVIQAYRSHQLPLDCVYLDIDHQDGYRSLTWDRTRFSNPQELSSWARSHGVRLVPIVDPGIAAEPGEPMFEEAARNDYLVRSNRGRVLVGEVWARKAAFPDFTRDDVRRWWGDQHRAFLDAGIAGFWNDMNEPSNFTPPENDELKLGEIHINDPRHTVGPTLPDAARHGARRHLEVHNVYGLSMSRATYEGIQRYDAERRPFVLTRAAYAGIQRYAAVWTGDNSSHWGHLELSVPMLVGLGLSGVPFAGVDIPGFIGRPSPELFVRWLQLGAFYPLMRNHSAKGAPWQEPWRFGDAALALARATLERRYRLLPALYTFFHEASRTGLPPLRPLVFLEPGSREALSAFDQFLFGPDVVVAPVVRPGQTKRLVYLPKGRWLPWANLETAGEPVEGRGYVIADAPLDTIPCWLREGGGMAMTRPALHTTTANWAHLEWHLFPGEEVRASLYEDEGEGRGAHRLTEITGRRQGDVLTLERRSSGTLPLERDTEVLVLHGVVNPKSVEGARSHVTRGRTLEVTVDAQWTQVRITA